MGCESAQQASAGGRVVHQDKYDTESEDITASVLLALDEIPGCDRKNPEFTGFNHVDPDAFNALSRWDAGEDSRVSFLIDDYQVTVTVGGGITVWSD